MTHDMQALEFKMSKVKAQTIQRQPFYAAIMCNLPLEIDENLPMPTAGTDGRRIIFHPDFVANHEVPELIWTLCHETLHCVFMHMFRRGHRDPFLWNISGDVVINHVLHEDGITDMPKGAIMMPDVYAKGGGTTDGVYDALMDMAEKQSGKGGGKGSGIPDQWDNCADAAGSPEEQAEAQSDMAVNVHQATAIARMHGKLGSALERFIDAALKPKVDWKEVLRRFVSQRAKIERSYATPRRRWLAEDIYLPAMGGEMMGELLIAVDCSGSVSDKEVAEFAAEMLAIKQDVSPHKIHVVYFHHEISKYECFAFDEDLVVKPNGTGGTAFSPIFAYAAAHDINPECCVVLTDLCCSDFGPAPDYPVLWVSNHSDQAPWGQVVMMKDRR